MRARRQPETHFLSLHIIENVYVVLDKMEDLTVSPCLVTLSLASVLQGAQGNTTLSPGRDDRGTVPVRASYLELCCGRNQVCTGNLVCVSCLCRCQQNYSYKTSSKSCEAEFPFPATTSTTSTTTTTNTTTNGTRTVSDGLLPGEACLSSAVCVEGLVCVRAKCRCPEPCEYLADQMACDCGSEEVSLVWPIIIGLSVGCLIVVFWISCITATLKTYTEERNKVMQLQQPFPRISTLGSAYGTSHLTLPTQPPPTDPCPDPPPAVPSTPYKGRRISRQSVAPTSPLHPVFRPPSPPTTTYHYNSTSTSTTYLSPPPLPPIRNTPYPPPSMDPQTPLLYPTSAPQDRKMPLNFEDASDPPPPWSDLPRSARF